MSSVEQNDVVVICKMGVVNRRLRAQALLMSDLSLNQWHHKHYDEDLRMFVLGESAQTKVHATLTDSVDWIESDVDGLMKSEPFLAKAKFEHQLQLSQLRPIVLLDIHESLYGRKLPLFLATKDFGTPKRFVGKLGGVIESIDFLPEVSEYVENEFAAVKDDPDGRIAIEHLRKKTDLSLPKDTLLPCCVSDEANKSDAVYRIVDQAGTDASVDLWVIDPAFNLQKGSLLQSRRSGSKVPVTIGRVTSFTQLDLNGQV